MTWRTWRQVTRGGEILARKGLRCQHTAPSPLAGFTYGALSAPAVVAWLVAASQAARAVLGGGACGGMITHAPQVRVGEGKTGGAGGASPLLPLPS